MAAGSCRRMADKRGEIALPKRYPNGVSYLSANNRALPERTMLRRGYPEMQRDQLKVPKKLFYSNTTVGAVLQPQAINVSDEIDDVIYMGCPVQLHLCEPFIGAIFLNLVGIGMGNNKFFNRHAGVVGV